MKYFFKMHHRSKRKVFVKFEVFACFLVWAPPEVRDQIRKQFFDKVKVGLPIVVCCF